MSGLLRLFPKQWRVAYGQEVTDRARAGRGAWAVPRLAHGVVEIPGHWWSTLAVLPLLAGIVLVVVAWWPRRRRSGPSAQELL